jgi:hypothetical protein
MMRKSIEFWLFVGLVVPCGGQAQAGMETSQYPLMQYNAQVGVDVWRLSPGLPSALLGMPNNSQWRYRSESPWGTFDGRMVVGSTLVFTLKARADQSMGTHIDELAADWAYSPSFGFRAGVLSYKTSWCNTYNLDSPWVRENDPFCTSQNASEASGGAPGAQIYVNTAFGDYRVQAVAGMYRPLLFNYNVKEFSNLNFANFNVDVNNKTGASVSVLDTQSSTELRIGLLAAKQSERFPPQNVYEVDRVDQTYGITFAGVSFYTSPRLNVRLQTFRHDMTAARWAPYGSVWPHYTNGNEIMRRSNVAELNFQYSVQDVLALAISQFSLDSTYINTNYPKAGYTRLADFPYLLTSASASWRHDWRKGMFTSVQWTYNKVRAAEFQNPDQSTMAYRGAHGVGLRLAYQF